MHLNSLRSIKRAKGKWTESGGRAYIVFSADVGQVGGIPRKARVVVRGQVHRTVKRCDNCEEDCFVADDWRVCLEFQRR